MKNASDSRFCPVSDFKQQRLCRPPKSLHRASWVQRCESWIPEFNALSLLNEIIFAALDDRLYSYLQRHVNPLAFRLQQQGPTQTYHTQSYHSCQHQDQVEPDQICHDCVVFVQRYNYGGDHWWGHPLSRWVRWWYWNNYGSHFPPFSSRKEITVVCA